MIKSGFLAFVLVIGLTIMCFPAKADTPKDEEQARSLSEEKTQTSRPAADPFAIPTYKKGDVPLFGEIFTYTIGERDTLHDIARHYDLGFVELRAANPEVDAWAPSPGTEVIIPAQHITPRAPQKGVVINLAEMRLYYFMDEQEKPVTHPIGIGREGLETPLGQTTVVRKTVGPAWHPTKRMREENPDLPWRVGPGPANPLGTHALYLGWPTFLMHGTNKPWGIGRQVSSGCIRIYPEDIITFYNRVPVGTPVTVVEQPVKAAVSAGVLYLEVNATGQNVADIELMGEFEKDEQSSVPEPLKTLLSETVKDTDIKIDWKRVQIAWQEKRGFPVSVSVLPEDVQDTTEEIIESVENERVRPQFRYNR